MEKALRTEHQAFTVSPVLLFCRKLIESALEAACETELGEPTEAAKEAREYIEARTDWLLLGKPIPSPELRQEHWGSWDWACEHLGEDPEHARASGLPRVRTSQRQIAGLPEVDAHLAKSREKFLQDWARIEGRWIAKQERELRRLAAARERMRLGITVPQRIKRTPAERRAIAHAGNRRRYAKKHGPRKPRPHDRNARLRDGRGTTAHPAPRASHPWRQYRQPRPEVEIPKPRPLPIPAHQARPAQPHNRVNFVFQFPQLQLGKYRVIPIRSAPTRCSNLYR